ncbi:MAG: ParA family protein [Planctomycetota bacterium]
MTKVISFVNTKGGVGKSFLSVHLAVWLADRGTRVALIDADDQQTASKWLLAAKNHSVDVWVLEGASEEKRTNDLRNTINDLDGNIEFVIVDTKGSAGQSTHSAVLKSDLVCVPLQPSASDLWPIENALSTIRLSQEVRKGEPKAFLILNQTDDADVLARDVRELAKQFGIPMAMTNVKRLRAYRDAPGLKQFASRLSDSRGQKAAARLSQLFEELLGGLFAQRNREVANG